MNDFSERLGLQFHVGGGYAALIQNGATDNILQGIIGLTPQMKLSDKLSINADVSFMGNIRQQNGYDFEATPIQGGGFSGYYASATIGFNYYLVSKGIDKERLVVSFRGKTDTKYPGKTLEVDAANRRVSFSIIR